MIGSVQVVALLQRRSTAVTSGARAFWAGAQADIERIALIWRECLSTYRGPYLFGAPSLVDAMYASVCTHFLTYDVKLDAQCRTYCDRIMALSYMIEWVAAKLEADEIEELDAEC